MELLGEIGSHFPLDFRALWSSLGLSDLGGMGMERLYGTVQHVPIYSSTETRTDLASAL